MSSLFLLCVAFEKLSAEFGLKTNSRRPQWLKWFNKKVSGWNLHIQRSGTLTNQFWASILACIFIYYELQRWALILNEKHVFGLHVLLFILCYILFLGFLNYNSKYLFKSSRIPGITTIMWNPHSSSVARFSSWTERFFLILSGPRGSFNFSSDEILLKPSR